MGELIALPSAATPAPARAMRRKASQAAIAASGVVVLASRRPAVPLWEQPKFIELCAGLGRYCSAFESCAKSTGATRDEGAPLMQNLIGIRAGLIIKAIETGAVS
jgi:hypothetical protein